ncbi:hypothetical protein [Psychromonas aquimarina]|uniref:hypothetical protein n=1 Tax=Psychromonas aquimarina TaxID=444919 RepID=UPI00041977BA|nr:hypothetical protein [Psychromonas aquimarina]
MPSRLQIKLQENKERKEREQLLKLLPLTWVDKIEQAECVSSFDFFSVFPVLPGEDFACHQFLSTKSMIHTDFDDITDVQSYLVNNTMILKPPVLCWFGIGSAFRVNEPFEIKWLAEISALSYFRIYMVEENQGKGIICDEYIGYLSEERSTNTNERIFDVVCFS